MKRNPRYRRGTYLIALEPRIATFDEMPELAEYLSFIAVADFDVVVIDASPLHLVERNRRILRWVARHVAARQQHRTPWGQFDAVRAAIDAAACDKVIVAGPEVRYSEESLDDL